MSNYYHSNPYFAEQPGENVVEFSGISYFAFFGILVISMTQELVALAFCTASELTSW